MNSSLAFRTLATTVSPAGVSLLSALLLLRR
jgi:hypothetical protein